ncbi:MAG: hypothetical protein HUJ68_14205, partial [Clostridia bacterium]|nr:hypothetical protein [Clostridia bacterium]
NFTERLQFNVCNKTLAGQIENQSYYSYQIEIKIIHDMKIQYFYSKKIISEYSTIFGGLTGVTEKISLRSIFSIVQKTYMGVFMKRRFLFICFVSIFISQVFSFGKENKLKTYTQEDMPTIIEETKKDIKDLKSLSDNYIIKNVKKGNKLIADSQKEIDKIKKSEKKQQAFLDSLEEIINFYEDITSDKKINQTKKELISYLEDVKEFNTGLTQMKSTLTLNISQSQRERAKYEGKEDRTSRSNLERIDAEIDAYNRQLTLIENFQDRYSTLIPLFEKVEEDVDFFIVTIKNSAKVYRATYNTAKLAKNISKAISTIDELNTLSSLTSDLEGTWSTLDSIIVELTDMTTDFS